MSDDLIRSDSESGSRGVSQVYSAPVEKLAAVPEETSECERPDIAEDEAPILISPARSSPSDRLQDDQTAGVPGPDEGLFVTVVGLDVDFRLDEADFWRFFERYGTVTSVMMDASGRGGSVYFACSAERDSAHRCLDGVEIPGFAGPPVVRTWHLSLSRTRSTWQRLDARLRRRRRLRTEMVLRGVESLRRRLRRRRRSEVGDTVSVYSALDITSVE